MAWSDLTMSQRAEVIQMAVKNGMRDLNQIRSFYDSSVNKFAMGGPEEIIVTPSDNTKVNYQPSVYVGDSKEVQDALNAKIAAEGKAAYATARFLPYIKYATDVVDWTSGDPTDAIQMAGNAMQASGNIVANMYQGKSIGDVVKIGHRNHRRATKLTTAMVNNAKTFGRLLSKIGNIAAFPGLVGDVIQSYGDYKNLIEAEKNYNNVSTKVFDERVKTHPAVKIKSIGGPLFNNEFAEGGDLTDDDYFSIMEKVAKENWRDWGDESEDAALVRILNDNSYDYRGYYNKYPESEANAETHWSDEFKTVYHPTFSDESIYSGSKSKFNPDGLIGGHWEGEHFIPAPWQEDENEYSSGGKIHIKPENRGKFTALKKRTGHSASWFKAHGTPAQKKMAIFALNAAKWNH